MKLPANTILPSPFMGNFFCLIPNTNLAFVAIAKNGVTFLKKVAVFNAMKKWTDRYTANTTVGYHEDSTYLISVKEMSDYEKQNGKLIKFAVWRNPIERIISTYKLFCLEKEYRTYFHYLGLYEDNSFDRFMKFLEFEWHKKDLIKQDEHIRRQVDYYQPEDVDYIVPIFKLYDFLTEHNISFIKEQTNKTSSQFVIKNKEYIKNIKEYYQKDWEIKCNYN